MGAVDRDARRGKDFAPYVAKRLERMRCLKLIGDVVAEATVEADGNHSTRIKKLRLRYGNHECSEFPAFDWHDRGASDHRGTPGR
jgi:hypothetical protein